MAKQRSTPWLAILLGLGCVGILCIGILAFGGGVAYYLAQNSNSGFTPTQVSNLDVVTPQPTSLPSIVPHPVQPTNRPSPTVEPSQVEPTQSESTPIEPTQSGSTLTGNQRLDEHSLFDDFSSDALGWPVFDDGTTILKYENQAYSFQIKEPDYYDWAYLPVEFTAYEIWFDVQGLSGPQDGTFGVFCQYQDEDNYYYAEFDLQENNYMIGQILDGEYIPLTKQNSSGEYWQESVALNSPATTANRIGVSCYLDSITLYVNDEWVDEVSVSQPFDQPGEAAFFVYTFDFAGENGYKVFFDDVEAWQPLQ